MIIYEKEYLSVRFKNFFPKDNPVDNFTIVWNTDENFAQIGQTKTFYNIASLKNIASSTSNGYVITLPSSILSKGRLSVSLYFLKLRMLKCTKLL